MTDPHDPMRQALEEIEAKRQKIAKARQEQRAHDPELKRHVSSLQQRILRLRAATGGSQYDYETLRKEYDAKANAEVRELQKAARQERIQKLIAQADLNPDWIFDKMDSGDPALQYPIETARYFISGFEHWEKSGGGCMLIYGDYGTGKSTLAGAVAHELIARHQKSVIFQQWASIVDRLFFNVIQDQEERNQYRRAIPGGHPERLGSDRWREQKRRSLRRPHHVRYGAIADHRRQPEVWESGAQEDGAD